MKVKNVNSSSQRTRNKIKEVFAELFHEKGEIKNITVTELVKRANITRSSFYTHYDNIYDVAKDLQDEALELLSLASTHNHTLDDLDNYFDEVTKHLKENEEIYSMILSSDEPLIFTERLNKLIIKKLYSSLKDVKNKDLILNVSFFTDGCMSLLIKHFRGEIDSTLDDINEYTKKMFIKVFLES